MYNKISKFLKQNKLYIIYKVISECYEIPSTEYKKQNHIYNLCVIAGNMRDNISKYILQVNCLLENNRIQVHQINYNSIKIFKNHIFFG